MRARVVQKDSVLQKCYFNKTKKAFLIRRDNLSKSSRKADDIAGPRTFSEFSGFPGAFDA